MNKALVHGRVSVKADTSQLTANKKFGRYKDEGEKNIRKADVKQDHFSDSIIQVFGKILEEWDYLKGWAEQPRSDQLFDLESALTSLEITPQAVLNFCIRSAEYEDHDYFEDALGIFLTDLIEVGQQPEYSLFLGHLSAEIEIFNKEFAKKHVEIIGGRFNEIGHEMQSGTIDISKAYVSDMAAHIKGGKITVDGNVQEPIGSCMSGGEIIINGNAIPRVLDFIVDEEHGTSHGVGFYMKAGKMVIKGDASKLVGHGMTGGEIHLEGDFVSLGDINGGKIYHKGKLIVNK